MMRRALFHDFECAGSPKLPGDPQGQPCPLCRGKHRVWPLYIYQLHVGREMQKGCSHFVSQRRQSSRISTTGEYSWARLADPGRKRRRGRDEMHDLAGGGHEATPRGPFVLWGAPAPNFPAPSPARPPLSGLEPDSGLRHLHRPEPQLPRLPRRDLRELPFRHFGKTTGVQGIQMPRGTDPSTHNAAGWAVSAGGMCPWISCSSIHPTHCHPTSI